MADLTFNERQLFELVHRGSHISRAEIAEITNLTPPTVSRLVSRLLEIGLLSERADRSGQLGQPRRQLAVNKGQAFSVGVNFMRGRFDLSIIDIAGDVAFVETAEIDDITPHCIARAASDQLDVALARTGIDHARLIGAGFSLPGGFAEDGETLIAHSYFEPLDQMRLAPIFGEALGLRCSVDTDGACAALGEFLYGLGTDHDTFFFVHIGHGVGGGMIIDGRLYRGPHGNASKPGVLFPYEGPRPSGQDLVETLQAAGIAIQDIADLSEVGAEAQPTIDAWIDRASDQLATLSRVITGFFDPQVIFVGGRLPEAINARLVDRISGVALPGPSRGLKNAPVRVSKLGSRSGVLGAASLPVFDTFFPGSIHQAGNAYVNGRRRGVMPKLGI
ncbi:MAG: ROK family transcriptional regulator [Hyphomonas sp.]|nr:ROK family transcriptional regulator [Hyphomonas sp.]